MANVRRRSGGALLAGELERVAGRPVPGIQEEWGGIWSSMDPDVVSLAERLKESYIVGVLSNSTLRLEKELLEGNGIHDIFHVVINSARVGIAKPDAGIYHHAAKAVGLEPSACVHIDDLPHNVEGAREAGFQAVHYAGDFPRSKRRCGRSASSGRACPERARRSGAGTARRTSRAISR